MTARACFLIATSLTAACGAALQHSHSAAAPAAQMAGPATAPESTLAAPMAPAARTAEPTGFADVNTDNSLISNGSVAATSDRLLETASAFRRELYRLGGRVYTEQVHYRDQSDDATEHAPSSAVYRVKILPRMLPDLLDWLGKHSMITAQDVSSIIAMESEADASIVRADVKERLAELDAQLADGSLDPQIRAALEQERTKLVGAEIADPNAIADNTKRVAVLEVRLDAPHLADPYAHGKLLGHARGSFLDLGILGSASSNHVGGGIGIGGRSPVSTLEVIGYAANDMDPRAGVTATLGFGTYAKAFGGGTQHAFNPYVGARFGYAYLDASYLAVAAEVGVELYKQRGVVWTVSARPMGLVGTDSKTALEVGTTIGLAL